MGSGTTGIEGVGQIMPRCNGEKEVGAARNPGEQEASVFFGWRQYKCDKGRKLGGITKTEAGDKETIFKEKRESNQLRLEEPKKKESIG